MTIYSKTYKNGLRLCLEKNDRSVISTNILFNVGSQNETKKQEGYSHFIEHLIFKSSKNYSTTEIMDKLSFYGADFNAYTSRMVTRYIFKCLKENFEPCFEIYSDMLINPKFDEDEVNKERNVVIEEMKKCDDDPVEVLYRTIMNNYYNGHSYAHDELGTEDIISSVTTQKLAEYKNKHYTANNCIITIAGNIEFEELDKIVQKYFVSQIQGEGEPCFVDIKDLEINVKNKYDIVVRDDNQVNVCVHIKSVSALSNYKYVADLYTSILGNSQNSRLYKIIREELGLVYSVYAFSDSAPMTGGIFIMFATRPKNVKKAISEIKRIICELANEGVSEEELERVKNLKKSTIEYNSETNTDIAEINGSMLHLFGKCHTISERKQKFDEISLEQVNEYAKIIANEKCFNVVAVGKNVKMSDLEQF